MVTSGFFRSRYVKPAFGRYVLPEEDQVGREHVAVLSYGLFEQRFAGDSRIVGRPIRMNGETFTVVGVAPPEFSIATPGDRLWTALALTDQHKATFSDHWLTVYAKRKPGVDPRQAQRDIERVSREITRAASRRHGRSNGAGLRLPRRSRRRPRAQSVGIVRCGWVRAAAGMSERDEPPARPSDRAAKGDGDPGRARRHARAHR